MAQTLEEFLVRIKYSIDQPGQQTFFDTLKKMSASVSGAAAEITGLTSGILILAENMAKAGERFYWMSQRLGDSVADIQGAAYALSNLGISADEAYGSFERFGSWARMNGPAATAYLRSIGVTATDTLGQAKQLGEYFRTHGAMQPGSMGYSIMRQTAQMMGIDERTMLAMARGETAANMQQAGMLQRLVWGKDWQNGPQKFADQSLQVMNEFRKFGFLLENLYQKFGVGFFDRLIPELQRLNRFFMDNLPAIEHFFDVLGKGLVLFVQVVREVITGFHDLPPVVKDFIEVITGAKFASMIIGSPILRFLALLTGALLLVDDYMRFKKGRPAFLDWTGFDKLITKFGEMGKSLGEWLDGHEKIRKSIEWLGATAGGLAVLGMFEGRFLSMIKILSTAITMSPLGLFLRAMMALGVVAAVSTEQKGEQASAAKAAGYGEVQEGAWGYYYEKDGKQYPMEEVMKELKFNPYSGVHDPTMPDYKAQPMAPGSRDWNPPRKQVAPQLGPTPDPQSLIYGYNTGGAVATLASYTPGFPGGGGGFGRQMSPEAFFDMLNGHFTELLDKTTDILDTLTDMAKAMGAGTEARSRGGSGFAGVGGGGDGSLPTPIDRTGEGSMKDRAQRLMTKIMAHGGVSQNEAAGIVSAFLRESGGYSNISRGGGAFQYGTGLDVGLAQWTGSRHRDLEAFAKLHNLDPKDEDTQLAFMWHEFETKYPRWREMLARGGEAFGDYYEAGGKHGGYSHGDYWKWLFSLPLGGGAAGSMSAPSSGGPGVYHVVFNITSPSPASAAAQVNETMQRFYEQQNRATRRAISV